MEEDEKVASHAAMFLIIQNRCFNEVLGLATSLSDLRSFNKVYENYVYTIALLSLKLI